MGEEKSYTLEEVSEHNSHKDCWLIIDSKVYDVTKFLDEHPGGDEVLLTATGKDATDDFEDVGHSSTARAMMAEYYVGNVDPSALPVKKESDTPPKVTQAQHTHDKPCSGFAVKLLQFLIPIIILGLAIGIRFYTKSSDA